MLERILARTIDSAAGLRAADPYGDPADVLAIYADANGCDVFAIRRDGLLLLGQRLG